jgi:long-chain fatty acid transport protein
VAYGFNLGLMLTPQEGTRFGLTYRSEVDLEFKDTVALENIGPVLQSLLNLSGGAGRQ